MAYAADVLADTPVIYWKLDEAAGVTADDVGSANLDGTYNNAPTLNSVALPARPGGNAPLFAAASLQSVSRASDIAMNPGTSDFSTELWFKINTVGGSVFIAEFGGGTGAGWELWITAAGILNARTPGVGAAGPVSLARVDDNAWHHSVVTYDRDGLMRLYVDGVVQGAGVDISGSAATNLNNSGNFPLFVGRRNAGSYVSGALAHFAYYTKVLTQARVTAHFTGATPLASGTPTVDALASRLGVGAGETVLAEWRAWWITQGFTNVPNIKDRLARYVTLAASSGFTLVSGTASDIENDFWRQYTP